MSTESAATVIRFAVPITSSVAPVLVIPAPAVIEPAPENCAQGMAVVFSVPPVSAVRPSPCPR